MGSLPETYRIVNGKKKVISRKVVSRKVVQGKTTYGINKSMWKRLAAYATEMGVSPELVDDMNSARHDSLYFLTVDRRKKLALVTRIESAASLSNRYACKTGSGPGTVCVTREDFAPKPAPSAAAAAPVDGKAALQRVGIPPDAKPMTVVIVRNSSQNCEPLCPQWIAARGVITPDTPKLFKAVLDQLGDLKLPVVFHSPGGDFDAGLEIGRMIRARDLDTMIVGTSFIRCAPEDTGCKPPGGGTLYKGFPMAMLDVRCDGACLFAALGGTTLLSVASETVLDVPDAYSARGDERPVAVQLMLYFAEMGADKQLLTMMQELKPRARIALNAEQQASLLNAITPHPWTVEMLAPSQCQQVKRSSLCVKLGAGS